MVKGEQANDAIEENGGTSQMSDRNDVVGRRGSTVKRHENIACIDFAGDSVC